MYELIEAFRMNIPNTSNYDPWSRSLVCFVVCTGTTVKVDTVDLSSTFCIFIWIRSHVWSYRPKWKLATAVVQTSHLALISWHIIPE